MDEALKAQQERWRRFAEWERERLRSSPRDYRRTLAWMAEARDLARRWNSSWGSRPSAEEHWAHLAEVQRRLRRGLAPR